MKYLILGSNSFAGSNLIDYLITKEIEVMGCSRSAEPSHILLRYKDNPRYKKQNNKNIFKFEQIDINKDLNQLQKIINQYKPNIIVDFVAQGMVAESWLYPEQWYKTNIVAKVKLHQFLRQCDFLDKYIRVSTPEIYGQKARNIVESDLFDPSTPYAVSQAAIDMSLKIFYQQYEFPVVFTRFANFYGPYQHLYRIVPRTIIYAKIKRTLCLHGGGESIRSFMHGLDVANGIFLAVEKGKIGESYHFSSCPFISIKDLIKKITSQLNVEFDTLVKTSEDRLGKDQAYIMDTKKVECELGWEPNVSLDEGINKTIVWIEKYLNKIKTMPLTYIHKE